MLSLSLEYWRPLNIELRYNTSARKDSKWCHYHMQRRVAAEYLGIFHRPWYQLFLVSQLFLNHHHHLPPSFHPLHRLPLLTPFNRPLPKWSCSGSCCHSGESCDVSSTRYRWSWGSDLWVAVCAYTHITTPNLSYSFQPLSQCTAVSSWYLLLVLSTDTVF